MRFIAKNGKKTVFVAISSNDTSNVMDRVVHGKKKVALINRIFRCAGHES